MSRVFAAYSVGGLIGPALGVVRRHPRPFLAYLALLLLAMPLVLFVDEPAARRDFAADRAALRTRGFWVASAAILFAVARARRARRRAAAALRRAAQPGADRRPLRRRLDRRCDQRRRLPAAGRRARWCSRRVVLTVAGIALAGMATTVPLWLLALLLAALGIGLGNTGSLGLLVEAVPVERIVTAMVVWSQIGIIGYLLGPLDRRDRGGGRGLRVRLACPGRGGAARARC